MGSTCGYQLRNPDLGRTDTAHCYRSAVMAAVDVDELLHLAAGAAESAYAPYSGIHVGAVLMTEDGELFTGCNVENVSYGLTVCAERSAVFQAVAKLGGDQLRIAALAIWSPDLDSCSPCGACRQVIAEFKGSPIVVFNSKGRTRQYSIGDLLPEGFDIA